MQCHTADLVTDMALFIDHGLISRINPAVLDMVDTLTVHLRLKLPACRPNLCMKRRRQPILYVRVTFVILFRYRLPVAVQFQPVLF